MATIKNVRQIIAPEHGGQVEVVYGAGDCKYFFPVEPGYGEVQVWIDAGNSVVGYSTSPFVTTPEFITASRAS